MARQLAVTDRSRRALAGGILIVPVLAPGSRDLRDAHAGWPEVSPTAPLCNQALVGFDTRVTCAAHWCKRAMALTVLPSGDVRRRVGAK